jgi:hydroxymethylbilane synthase
MNIVKLGTRSSPLALWQAEHVRDTLQAAHSDCKVELVHIKTEGDKILTASLAQIGGKGVFVKEIEEALSDGRIDLAVHSAKDLPTELPDGLTLSTIPDRADPHDVILTREPLEFADIPKGACLATGSLRRQSQLASARPDLTFCEFRGNLETRYQKFLESDTAALVLARAGVDRLEWSDRPYSILPYEVCLPAVGQGALAIEIREDNTNIRTLLEPLHHADTAAAIAAERGFLSGLGGGCQAPIAALGTVDGDSITLQGRVLAPDGTRTVQGDISGVTTDAAQLGGELARMLLEQGAADILAELE